MQKTPMQKSFDTWMLKRYGHRYDLTIDCEGRYCRESVRRMSEVWCECRELKVVRGEYE